MARSSFISGGSMQEWSDKVFSNSGSKSKPIFDEKTKSGSRKDKSGVGGGGGSIQQTPEQAYLSLANAGIKSSPVLFKVISTIHSAKGIGDLMEYLNKEETVNLESSLGNDSMTKEDVKEFSDSWVKEFKHESVAGKDQARNHRFLFHTVISFPKDLHGDHALSITREVMKNELLPRGVDYVMAGHFNEAGHNPHVHVAFKTKRLDGTKLRIDKEMIFNFRRAIAREARNFGINLHHGMSWERGMYSQGMSRTEYESGLYKNAEKLKPKSKELLKEQVKDLKEHVLKATNRTKGIDKIVFKQLRSLETRSNEQTKNLDRGIDLDNVPEL
jgi:hypothetical protein